MAVASKRRRSGGLGVAMAFDPHKRRRRRSMPMASNIRDGRRKRGMAMAMASSEKSNSDWGRLPRELLDSILGKVALLVDYVRFGAVCVPWRSSALDFQNQKRRIEFQISSSSFHHLKVPLLLFPTTTTTTTTSSSEKKEEEEYYWERSLYSVTQRKVMGTFRLPAPYANRRCCGSSHGWLITADDSLSLTLLNPFYIGGGQFGGVIRLPPVKYIPWVAFLPDNRQYRSELSIVKAVLSADPTLAPDDYVVMVLFGFPRALALFKSGDKDWTYVQEGREKFIPDDVIYHKGLIYVVSKTGILSTCDINDPAPRLRRVATSPCPTYMVKHYIVESPQGDLLQVCRHTRYHGNTQDDNDPRPPFLTVGFNVFKLLVLGRLTAWVQMKSLSNYALFLGDNQSTCVLANYDLSGCTEPSCSIFFTDDNLCHYPSLTFSPRIPSDMGIFNLEDQSFQPLYNPADSSQLLPIPPPIWFLPSIPPNWT